MVLSADLYFMKILSQIKIVYMRNLTLIAITGLLLLQFSPTQLNAASTAVSNPVTETIPPEGSRASELQSRLIQLKAMDRSGMNFSEKRQMRKEVRSIKKELKQINGGVYLSVGAIIIIVLLLILIL